MGTRRKAREKALQMLFQLDFHNDDIKIICRNFWVANPVGKKVQAFAEELVKGAYANRETIDRIIASTMENWTLDRLASVDKAILRLATYELMCVPDIPPNVTINEAVEIAKSYGTEESGRFVNGVLDKIRKELLNQDSTGKLLETQNLNPEE
jgi:N utilization substance protein B